MRHFKVDADWVFVSDRGRQDRLCYESLVNLVSAMTIWGFATRYRCRCRCRCRRKITDTAGFVLLGIIHYEVT